MKSITSDILRRIKRTIFPEIRRLDNLPRRERTVTKLLGPPTRLVDSSSFISDYYSIFEDEIYDFKPKGHPPKIIDGGANIGLATLYWKRNFPDSDITAFEPDPQIFAALKWNVEQREYGDVTLVQKGLWSEEGEVGFRPDGADGGHVAGAVTDEGEKPVVPVVRLAPYLDGRIDMLKLDIEGAEVEVLLDSAGHLGTVENLFVEYHSYTGEEQRVDEILRVLRQSGFRVHIQPELVADQPFVQRLESYGMDHRLNIFAYRQ